MHVNRCHLDFQFSFILEWLLPVFLPTLDIAALEEAYFFFNNPFI